MPCSGPRPRWPSWPRSRRDPRPRCRGPSRRGGDSKRPRPRPPRCAGPRLRSAHRFLPPTPRAAAAPPRRPQSGPGWGRARPGRAARGPSRLLAVRVGVRLLYFCFFLPPSRLSRASSHPCSSARFLHARPPAQPTDERSWVYSPLHYSAHARPASDGQSDTVSAPAARRARAGVSGRPRGRTCPGTAGETEAGGARAGAGRRRRGRGPPGRPRRLGCRQAAPRVLTRPPPAHFAFRSNVYAVTDPEPCARRRRRRPGCFPEALPARRTWLHRRPPLPSTTYACETVNLPECPITYLFWVLTLCTKTAAQVCFFTKRF